MRPDPALQMLVKQAAAEVQDTPREPAAIVARGMPQSRGRNHSLTPNTFFKASTMIQASTRMMIPSTLQESSSHCVASN